MIKTETVRATSRFNKFAIYAWAVLGFNVLVVLWGAVVRATGSGAGCGNHWPTCNGVALPRAPRFETVVEFAHRATSGMALIAVVLLIVWAFRNYPRQHPARLGATLSGVFILTEALIGAGLVLLEYVASNESIARAWWLSLHFINTFTLLAVLALTAWWASGGGAFALRDLRRFALPLGALVLVGVSGAIAALGDTLFPVHSLQAGFAQDMSPTAHIFIRLRVFHPFIALLAAALVILTAIRIDSPATRNLKLLLLTLVAAQIIMGVMNFVLLAPVPMQVLHLLLADAVWITMVLFAATAAAGPMLSTTAPQV